MAFRTNYRFERVERDRAKKAKKEEKLKKRQERSTETPMGETPAPAQPTEPERQND